MMKRCNGKRLMDSYDKIGNGFTFIVKETIAWSCDESLLIMTISMYNFSFILCYKKMIQWFPFKYGYYAFKRVIIFVLASWTT